MLPPEEAEPEPELLFPPQEVSRQVPRARHRASEISFLFIISILSRALPQQMNVWQIYSKMKEKSTEFYRFFQTHKNGLCIFPSGGKMDKERRMGWTSPLQFQEGCPIIEASLNGMIRNAGVENAL